MLWGNFEKVMSSGPRAIFKPFARKQRLRYNLAAPLLHTGHQCLYSWYSTCLCWQKESYTENIVYGFTGLCLSTLFVDEAEWVKTAGFVSGANTGFHQATKKFSCLWS